MTLVKWLIKFLAYLAGMTLFLMLIAYLSGYGYLIKGVRLTYLSGYKSANINDGNEFDTRVVPNGSVVSPLPRSADYNKIALPADLQKMLDNTKSASFLVLRNDSIVCEYYFLGQTDTTRSNSFSMAKTITTMLVEKAIEEGLIKNWDAKVKDYLPWLKGVYAGELTLRHLSTMTAGLDWEESYYDPFGITARAYYDNDIEFVMHRVSVVFKPGEAYVYQSGATQLLGLCLRKAIKRNITDYAAEKLWIPLGAEFPAKWHLDDENGMELTYCCFNAVTRDFARLGKMVLHQGRLNGGHFIDSSFFTSATKAVKAEWYGQSFWLGNSNNVKWHMLNGAHGQFIIVVPEKQLVIVRTGYKTKKDPKSKITKCAQTYASGAIFAFGIKP